MKRIPTYRQRLAIALNSAPRITLHCAFYYGGMITPERYDLITALVENAAEHRNTITRITA